MKNKKFGRFEEIKTFLGVSKVIFDKIPEPTSDGPVARHVAHLVPEYASARTRRHQTVRSARHQANDALPSSSFFFAKFENLLRKESFISSMKITNILLLKISKKIQMDPSLFAASTPQYIMPDGGTTGKGKFEFALGHIGWAVSIYLLLFFF